MSICYVKAYFDWIEQTAVLSDAERGRLFISILEYARSGLEPKLDGRESILFPVFKSQVDRDRASAVISAENGKKGGRPKTKDNPTKPNLTKDNLTKGNKDKDKDKDKDKEEDKDYLTPYSPPKGGVAGFMKKSFSEFANGNTKLLTALNDFAAMRKRINKPIATEQTVTRLLDKLKNDFTPEEWIPVLNQSTDRCWQDIYPLKASSKYTADTAPPEPGELPDSIRRT